MDNGPVKILLLEDNRLDARLLQLFLGESHTTQYQLTQVERLADGLKKLEEETFQLILCDLSLADSHDLETFQSLHRSAHVIKRFHVNSHSVMIIVKQATMLISGSATNAALY